MKSCEILLRISISRATATTRDKRERDNCLLTGIRGRGWVQGVWRAAFARRWWPLAFGDWFQVETRWSLMSGGFGIVDFMKLATLHGTLSTTSHTVDGDTVFGKKLVEIDVLSTRIRGVISEMASQNFIN